MKQLIACLSSGVSLLLPLSAVANAAPAGDRQVTQITAGDLHLTFRHSANGVRTDSLRDARTGLELLASNPAAVFSITFRQAGSTNDTRLTADAGWRQCEVQKRGKRLELRWSKPENQSLAGVSITVTVLPDNRASAFRWHLRVNNSSTNWSVWRVTFPEIALADLGTNAAVFFPQGPGIVQRGVWHRPFRYGGEYPGGWCAMQFMAAYREGEQPTGLYVAIHDPWGATKDLATTSDPATHTLRLTYTHPAPNMGLAGNSFSLEGEAVWQLLRGDWFDAATIYKQWASREAKWWPRLTREGRADTPRWARDLNAWTMTGMTAGWPSNCVDEVKRFHQFLEMPIGFHWYNWHQIPFDNDYPHYFPAKEGFTQGVAELRSAGIRVMPYINGRLWDSRDRGTDDFQFSRLALPSATKQPDGSPYLEEYGRNETNGQPVRLAVMCPASPFWQATVSNIVARLLDECGTDAVYIDQVAAAAPKLCFDRTHGHSLGGGRWWNEGYWKMLENIRRAMPPGTMLTTECNAEPFLRWFDGYLTWHWQFDGQVPAFSAVYGGTVQMFGRAFRGGGTKDLALRMKAGQQFVFGEQLGWLDPVVVGEPANAEFFRQLAQLRMRFSRYFSAGEMTRPPRLLGASPKVRADWQWSGEWWVTTDAVLTGAWRLPRGKRLSLFFVNVSDQTVSTELLFDPTTYALRGQRVHVERTRADRSSGPSEVWSNAASHPLVLAPHQAEVWELTW